MPVDNVALQLFGASEDLIHAVTSSNIFYWEWELGVLKWFYDLHNSFLDLVLPLITHLGDAGIFWILLTIVLLIIPKTRHLGLASLIALVFDVIMCNGVIKPLVARCRPGWLMFFDGAPDWIKSMKMLIKFPDDYSFPSGHTAASFASAVALFGTLKNKYKWWGVGALLLAVIIGLSRLYVVVHWPTDVICGMIIGIICGIIGWALGRRLWPIVDKKIQSIKGKMAEKKDK